MKTVAIIAGVLTSLAILYGVFWAIPDRLSTMEKYQWEKFGDFSREIFEARADFLKGVSVLNERLKVVEMEIEIDSRQAHEQSAELKKKIDLVRLERYSRQASGWAELTKGGTLYAINVADHTVTIKDFKGKEVKGKVSVNTPVKQVLATGKVKDISLEELKTKIENPIVMTHEPTTAHPVQVKAIYTADWNIKWPEETTPKKPKQKP